MVPAGCACKRLRAALLGPGSGQLWSKLVFRSSSPGCNRLQQRHSSRAALVTLYGSGWLHPELKAVLASLPAFLEGLWISDLNDHCEAACIKTGLADCYVADMSVSGTCFSALPPRVQSLCLHDDYIGRCLAEQDRAAGVHKVLQELESQRRSTDTLQQLLHLQRLTQVRLVLPLWRVSKPSCSILARLGLQALELVICQLSAGEQHELGALRCIRSLQLDLTLVWERDGPGLHTLSVLLLQLQTVPLRDFKLSCEDLSSDQQRLLADCTVKRQLTPVPGEP